MKCVGSRLGSGGNRQWNVSPSMLDSVPFPRCHASPPPAYCKLCFKLNVPAGRVQTNACPVLLFHFKVCNGVSAAVVNNRIRKKPEIK